MISQPKVLIPFYTTTGRSTKHSLDNERHSAKHFLKKKDTNQTLYHQGSGGRQVSRLGVRTSARKRLQTSTDICKQPYHQRVPHSTENTTSSTKPDTNPCCWLRILACTAETRTTTIRGLQICSCLASSMLERVCFLAG